ncbi:MAG: hypothetical protein JW841_04585 [Deltaproteobacteria bacterium]|nr:hypothetical protein [Deltaproteobacteria bacterium]
MTTTGGIPNSKVDYTNNPPINTGDVNGPATAGATPPPTTDDADVGDGYDTEKPKTLPQASSSQPEPGSDEEEIYQKVIYPGAWPCNSATKDANAKWQKNQPGYLDTVAAAQILMDDPSPEAIEAFMAKFLSLPIPPNGNIMESLLQVIKDTIVDANEDKRYRLMKLNNFNKIADALSQQLKVANDANQKLTLDEKGKKGDDLADCRVPYTARTYSTRDVGADGQAVLLSEETEHCSRSSLGAKTKDIERQQEEVRNNRQMEQTAFQAIDQRVNQLYQIAAGVSKTMNEMRSQGAKNML